MTVLPLRTKTLCPTDGQSVNGINFESIKLRDKLRLSERKTLSENAPERVALLKSFRVRCEVSENLMILARWKIRWSTVSLTGSLRRASTAVPGLSDNQRMVLNDPNLCLDCFGSGFWRTSTVGLVAPTSADLVHA
jgi:hypothetical protein